MNHAIMSILPGAKTERHQILCDVFETMRQHYRQYRRSTEKFVWLGGQSGALERLDRHWEYCVQNVKDVRSWIDQDGNGEIAWHKIVAITQCNILQVLPLTFDDKSVSRSKDYILNTNYAFLFNLKSMADWCEHTRNASLLEFDSRFLSCPFSPKEEYSKFLQKQSSLFVSMLHNQPSLDSLSKVSRLWADTGDQILTAMSQNENRKR